METFYGLCDNRGQILELFIFPVEFSINITLCIQLLII